MSFSFSEDQIKRYARHILLPQIGGEGQAKLLNSKVLLVGAGGLGSPLALYLAAAGVGTIGVADGDRVDLSNLQRQIAYAVDDLGEPKTAALARRLQSLNPETTVVPYAGRLDADNGAALIAGYDLVADGSDNFETRFLVNDLCFRARKPLVSAAVIRFDGQLSTYKPHEGGPCLRCLFRRPPPPEEADSCARSGVLGAVAGVMGTLQATEVLKELLGAGTGMAGRLMIVDALDMRIRIVKVEKDPGCPLCGDGEPE